MSLVSAIFISLMICILAATLEGVCAGKHVKSYLAGLRWPRYSTPLWVWYIIGALYYLIFCFVIYRVLRSDNEPILRPQRLA